jgi:hypothetical protein
LDKYTDVIGKNKAAIHVRRGDYMKMKNIYYSLDMSYYMGAMDYLKSCGVKEFLVFSTDIPWCKEAFKGDQFTFIQDDTFVELFLMSRCDHMVTANSAFSWWGGYRITNPSRKIIAPKRWFVDNRKENIVPQSWIRI